MTTSSGQSIPAKYCIRHGSASTIGIRKTPLSALEPRDNELCLLPMIAWLKAFHIVFVVAWFAGLFYLPRLFVYHADATDEPGIKRFVVMERRLLALTTVAAVLAAILGVAMIAAVPAYL